MFFLGCGAETQFPCKHAAPAPTAQGPPPSRCCVSHSGGHAPHRPAREVQGRQLGQDAGLHGDRPSPAATQSPDESPHTRARGAWSPQPAGSPRPVSSVGLQGVPSLLALALPRELVCKVPPTRAPELWRRSHCIRGATWDELTH